MSKLHFLDNKLINLTKFDEIVQFSLRVLNMIDNPSTVLKNVILNSKSHKMSQMRAKMGYKLGMVHLETYVPRCGAPNLGHDAPSLGCKYGPCLGSMRPKIM